MHSLPLPAGTAPSQGCKWGIFQPHRGTVRETNQRHRAQGLAHLKRGQVWATDPANFAVKAIITSSKYIKILSFRWPALCSDVLQVPSLKSLMSSCYSKFWSFLLFLIQHNSRSVILFPTVIQSAWGHDWKILWKESYSVSNLMRFCL